MSPLRSALCVLLATAACLAVTACARRAGPPPDVPPPADAVAREIETAERAWGAAIVARDSAALVRLLAPELVVESDVPGLAVNRVERAQWLYNTLHRLRLDSVAVRDVRVTVRGARGDTAVAELWFWWKPGRVPNENRLEDTWVRRTGTWQAVRRVIRETRPAAP